MVLDNVLYFSISDIGKGKLTVGKIYGGLLILENWKASKFGNMPNHKVSHQVEILRTDKYMSCDE